MGEIYNIGGGRKSNCSLIEAINCVESLANIKIKKIQNNRKIQRRIRKSILK